MIDPIAVGLTKEYIAKQDRDSASPTIWIIGAMDSLTQSKLAFTFMRESEKSHANENPSFMVVKVGLKGFKNFGSAEFRTEKSTMSSMEDIDVVPDDIIKMIPLHIIRELSEVIWQENQVTDDLKKN